MSEQKRDNIFKALNFRTACKEFDVNKKIPREDFEIILEAARLSPSSFGLEPWKFLIINNPKIRERLVPFCWGAQKQLLTANHFVVILARSGLDMRYDSEYIENTMHSVHGSLPDIIKKRLEKLKYFQENDFKLTTEKSLFEWSCRQSYIALGDMMTVASLLEIDSCPIEGFNINIVEELLMNEGILDKKHFGIACMVAFGYRNLPPKQRTRRTIDQVVQRIE